MYIPVTYFIVVCAVIENAILQPGRDVRALATPSAPPLRADNLIATGEHSRFPNHHFIVPGDHKT